MNPMTRMLLVLLLGLTTLRSPLQAEENWPHWRGPEHNGIAAVKGVAATWNAQTNIAWRTALPGPAPSTPIVWGDTIFVTSSADDDLMLIALNRQGELLWRQTVDRGNRDYRQGESNHAAPSPVTDGERVYVFFGSGVLAAYDFTGKQQWRVDVQAQYGTFGIYFGMANSPLIDDQRLYLPLLHDHAQTVVAFDKNTGRELWRAARPSLAQQESRHSYASPLFLGQGAQRQLIVHGSDVVSGHQLETGAEIWRCGGLQKDQYNPFYRFVATPAAAGDLLVVPSAKGGPVLALKPLDARGDITGQAKFQVWKHDSGTPDVPSPLIHAGLVYLCSEKGVLTCSDAATGEVYYRERTHNQRHRASPVLADGHLYLTAMDGVVSVVPIGKKFQLKAQNHLETPISASPAFAGRLLLLRGKDALYAIGRP